MMALKNRNTADGFSFIEVIMSITVFALLATTLLSLQGNLLRRAIGAFDSWHSVVALKNSMYQGSQKLWAYDTISHTIKSERSPLQVTYQARKVSEKSSLKDVKNLRVIRATATWNSLGMSRREQLVSFAVVPDPPHNESGGQT